MSLTVARASYLSQHQAPGTSQAEDVTGEAVSMRHIHIRKPTVSLTFQLD